MNLAPRYRMGRIWFNGGHEVANGIQRGEPAREKIAIDWAFMEAGRDPKAHLERQFLQAVVVFPEPPFSFPTTMTWGKPSDLTAAFSMAAPRND